MKSFKVITIFTLFGIAYCSTLPSCSIEGLEKCNPFGEDDDRIIEAVEQLEDMCRYRNTVLKCQVDYLDSCPNDPTSGGSYNIKDLYKIFETFCDKSNPLRKKFLDNASCLNRVTRDIFDACGLGNFNMNDDGFCKQMKRVLKCTEESVLGKCGEDAREVFIFAQNPESRLREVNCL